MSHKPIFSSSGCAPPGTSADTACTDERLLRCALQMFAERGFAGTSVRELAKKAQVNVSAISYYFKDKAGLYRATYNHNILSAGFQDRTSGNVARIDTLSLRDVLSDLIKTYVNPLKYGDEAAWRLRLHLREMLEPTGLWEEEIRQEILPAQEVLQNRLCQELGLEQANDRVRRLALSIAGLGVYLLVSRDVVQGIAPQLLASEAAIDEYTDQLLNYALAMIECERRQIQSQSHI